jgi:hypothetical protein
MGNERAYACMFDAYRNEDLLCDRNVLNFGSAVRSHDSAFCSLAAPTNAVMCKL